MKTKHIVAVLLMCLSIVLLGAIALAQPPGYELEKERGSWCDEMWFTIVTGAEAQMVTLLNHDVDAGWPPTPDDIPTLINAGYMMSSTGGFSMYWYAINNRLEPLDDPVFRTALAYCMDKETIYPTLYGPLVTPIYNWAPPAQAYWCNPAVDDAFPRFNLQTAIDTLVGGGYTPVDSGNNPVANPQVGNIDHWHMPGGTTDIRDLEQGVPVTSTLGMQVSQWIEFDLHSIGLPIYHTPLPFNYIVYQQWLAPPYLNWDMTIGIGLTFGANPAFDTMYHSDAIPFANIWGLQNAAVDSLIEQSKATFDWDEAQQAIWDCEELLTELMPMIPMTTSQMWTCATGPHDGQPGVLSWINMEGYGGLDWHNLWSKLLGRREHGDGSPYVINNWLMGEDANILNPLASNTNSEWQLLSLVYSTLLQRHPYTQEMIPWCVTDFPVVQAWNGTHREVAPDVWVYDPSPAGSPGDVIGEYMGWTLRDDMTWHDGALVQSDDVEFCLDLLVNQNNERYEATHSLIHDVDVGMLFAEYVGHGDGTTTDFTVENPPVSEHYVYIEGVPVTEGSPPPVEGEEVGTGDDVTTVFYFDYKPVAENSETVYIEGNPLTKDPQSVAGEGVGTGDGSTVSFVLEHGCVVEDSETIYVDGEPQTRDANYTIEYVTGCVTFTTAPASESTVTADYSYNLYIMDYPTGTMTFADPPRGRTYVKIAESQITTNILDQESPAVYGDIIVWEDKRNGNLDIYMYNLTSATETQITTDGADQGFPAVYGDIIVWMDTRNLGWDIYMYNLTSSTETRITTGNQLSGLPVVYGDIIVWIDNRNGNWDIYMYNLTSSTETQITTNTANQGEPAVYGDIIVWEDYRNGFADIYMYNLTSSTETQITTDPAHQGAPAIHGDIIVWQDQRNIGWDIYMYNLTSSTETRLTTAIQDQESPAIHGDLIVWQDGRNLVGFDIYMYDLLTGIETQVTTQAVDQRQPAIYGNLIVWEDERNLNWDIYLAEISFGETITADYTYIGYSMDCPTGTITFTSAPGNCWDITAKYTRASVWDNLYRFDVYYTGRYLWATTDISDIALLTPKHIWGPYIDGDDNILWTEDDEDHRFWDGSNWIDEYGYEAPEIETPSGPEQLTHLIGNGPFVYPYGGWTPGVSMHLVRFPGWHYTRILRGDNNLDGIVDTLDLWAPLYAMGTQPGMPRWRFEADMANPSGLIDGHDIEVVYNDWGYYWYPYSTLPP